MAPVWTSLFTNACECSCPGLVQLKLQVQLRHRHHLRSWPNASSWWRPRDLPDSASTYLPRTEFSLVSWITQRWPFQHVYSSLCRIWVRLLLAKYMILSCGRLNLFAGAAAPHIVTNYFDHSSIFPMSSFPVFYSTCILRPVVMNWTIMSTHPPNCIRTPH